MRKIFIPTLLILIVLAGCVSPAKGKTSSVRHSIINDAKKYLGTPYLYGGTTPSGFDCSGFVQFIYGKNGYKIPRTVTEMQSAFKKTDNPSLGDIVTFKDPKHVGILIGGNRFIHASSTRGVVIDNLSDSWFKKRKTGYYTAFY